MLSAVSGGDKGIVLYEVRALPGKDIHITCLGDGGEVTEVPLDEFNRRVVKGPFLIAKGTRCYYSGPRNWEMRVPVPPAGEKLDPSRDDFRDLYAFVNQWCDKRSALTYEVFFRDVGGAETRVSAVPFGGLVDRGLVLRGLQTAARRMKGGEGALESRMNEGSLVIRRRGGGR